MLLAVAGLSQLQVDERVKILASGDWSEFAPHERVVMHFARKLSKAPGTIRQEDVQTLMEHLGPDHTIDWVYHISWCNFMTRVADAFQIPLEPENVFLPPAQPKDAAAPSDMPRDKDEKNE